MTGSETSAYAALTEDDLVTGEAVALDLPPAAIGTRLVSGLIDVIVTMLLLVAFLVLFLVASLPVDGALVHVARVGGTALALVGFPTAVETLTRGRSLGKWAMGLRVVRDDAGPISFQHAFVRALIGVVETYSLSGVGAFFSILLSPKGKRLGDYAAGTYVVRERVRLALPPPVPMPPPLAGWAARADITPLPTSLALATRQLLNRSAQLSPQARARLADDLAARAMRHVAPPPPPGTPPEAFLAAVLAARRDRDAARLGREQRLRDRLTRRQAAAGR